MLLRTLTGKYVGQVRDYDYVAGMAAIRAGVAARLESARPATPVTVTRPNQNWDLIDWISRSKGQPKLLPAGV